MTRLTFAKTAAAFFLSFLLILLPVRFSPVLAQTAPSVGFTISPSVFAAGQSGSALLCMSPLPMAGTLEFTQNDVIGFQFDDSLGIVTSVDNPVSVHSSTLAPADFETHLNQVNHNKLSITYTNATAKTFVYMDTVCAKVTFTSGPTVGSALVRYSSKFTGISGIVGNLPYLSTSVVDFSAGAAGPQGQQGIQGVKGDKGDAGDTGPQGPPGTSPDLASVLARLSALEEKATPGRAYVANQSSHNISVIDTNTNTVVANVPLAAIPTGVAVNPAGTRLYVTDNVGKVSVIDTAINTVVATVAVGNGPAGVAVNPAGTRIYVTNQNSDSMSIIDITTNTVVATVNVGSKPSGVAVNGAGTRVYVVNSNNLSVINTATNTVVANVSVAGVPTGVAVHPAGTRLYVVGFGGKSGSLFIIDTATNTVVATVNVGPSEEGVAVNAAGTRVYVPNSNTADVSVVDTATNTVVATVPVGVLPTDVAVNAGGTRVYVVNAISNTVSVIDTATNTVVATIPVGSFPISIAVR